MLAHELSHHLGMHTIGLTIGHWLSLPVVLLARIGFWLQNVATAATDTFAKESSGLTLLGQLVAGLLNVLSLPFVAALHAADALGNVVAHRCGVPGRPAGRADGLRAQPGAARCGGSSASAASQRAVGWRARLAASHPPARTRAARIDAMLRHPAG